MTDEKLSRRSFFTKGIRQVAKTGTQVLEQKLAFDAKKWIRPPFAIDELDFLLNCDQCGDCIKACPHDVIFPLSSNCGVQVAGTPAMDIVNKGCHLCSDWPCVSACYLSKADKPKSRPPLEFPLKEISADEDESRADKGSKEKNQEKALQEQHHNLDASEKSVLHYELPSAHECPPLAKAHINKNTCLPYYGPECGACRGICPIDDVLTWENEKPSINEERCVGCGLCREVCISLPKSVEIRAAE